MAENTDVQAVVDKATSEEEFDALAFFSGSALPEDTVTVYADYKSAYRLAEIKAHLAQEKERDDTEGLSLTDVVENVDESEIEELTQKLKSSAVTFTLRGLAPAARDAIEKKARASNPYTEGAENSEYNEALNGGLIAGTIVSVQNATGRFDKIKWDAERVIKFSKVALESEFSKLYLGAVKVNYIGDAIDRAVSADFS